MLQKRLEDEFFHLNNSHQWRSCHSPKGQDFCSNDYLSYNQSGQLQIFAQKGLEQGIPLGSTGSRLISGSHSIFQMAEEKAAHFFQGEKSLFFGSGYLANFSVFSTFPQKNDVILLDSSCHACMKEGARASFAKTFKFAHNSLTDLQAKLDKFTDSAQHIWVGVESLYSMDGDRAPIEAMMDLLKSYQATLIIDEAHSGGIFGNYGEGLSASYAKDSLRIFPCGKAFGLSGAFVVGTQVMMDYLLNKARPFIFSTAPSPLIAFVLVKIFEDLLDSSKAQHNLINNIDYVNTHYQRFRKQDSQDQILPLIIGDNVKAKFMEQFMEDQGYFVKAIRPPTVPNDSARLRVTIQAHHQPKDYDNFFNAYELGLSLCQDSS